MTGLLDADAAASASSATAREAAPRRGAGWRRLRTDARLAWRQAWRTKGSSALVMTLVLLPVAGLAGGAIFWQSHVPTPEQAASLELGRNASWIEVVGGPDPTRWQAVDNPWDNGIETDEAGRALNPEEPRPDGPPPQIPAGSTVREIVEWGGVYVETAMGVGNVSVSVGDLWDDVFGDRYVTVSGTAPAGPDEAMVSPGLLERLGVEIGEDVVLIDADRAFTITGTLRRADAVPESEELYLPAHAEDLVSSGQVRWFVEDWQPDLAELAELNAAGYVAYARDLAVTPPPGARVSSWMTNSSQDTSMITTGLMIAVFSGYLVVLLAGAAFAVSARRQQQSLAVAASVGAARRDIFRIVVMQGTVLGATAGAIGIALGAGLAWAALEATDTGAVNTFWGNWGYRVPWGLLGVVAVFAVVVGTLAAVAPARAATRGDVLGALRGSRRPAVLRRKRPWWGLGLMITGLVATAAGALVMIVLGGAGAADSGVPVRVIALVAVALGPIVFQIGFLFAGHWVLVFVSRPLARLGLAPRLAGRDSAANPSRVVPAFAAIAACVFLASYVISTTALTSAQNQRTYWYNGPLGSVTASVYENGEPTGEPLATAEDILGPTSPQETAQVLAPTSTAYDLQTGLPEDPAHPVWAVAGQASEQCEPCGDRSMAMNGQLSIVDADDVSLLLDHPVDASVLAAYRAGTAITTTDDYISPDGEIVITRWTEQSRNDFSSAMMAIDWEADESERFAHLPPADAELPIPAERIDTGSGSMFQVMISPETAESLGIEATASSIVATYDEPLSQATIDRLNAEAQSVRLPAGAYVWLSTERGPDPIAPWLWLILAVAAVLVIGASAVVLGLARFERRPDDATLTAVGGSRGLRRRINAWQSAIIVGIGAVVGTVSGLIPVWGTAQSSPGFFTVSDMPWPWLGVLAIGLPVAITVVAWLVPPRHPELTRRTAIA